MATKVYIKALENARDEVVRAIHASESGVDKAKLTKIRKELDDLIFMAGGFVP